ncbi:hypothetical protein [Sphingomonas jatrophae]|uniref:5-bromo-4-chloroindolyl phosphate hydrolysis protein n=1 Tax=Sphingomonas jatrophae TaxID=1166337 RepID=A0A1I6JEP9_9SPHN|nr:hypothetical protein [Sphingomonas jatrophae]SFR77446.1 hypothetical protein SAMN05192580_0182 [Sphingomonas jatrophae]
MRDLERVTNEAANLLASKAGDMLHRLSPEGRRMRERAKARRRAAMMRGFRRLLLAWAAVVIGAMAYGIIVAPLGVTGVMAVAALLLLATVAVLAMSSTPAETPVSLAQADLPLLPSRTEAWLVSERPALPAPAARLSDGIGLRLEALAPQLQRLDPADPAAHAVRKLIAEDLPELVEGYKRVPESLRTQARDGRQSPDQQLTEGLRVVDEELKRMCEQLASGELDKLAVQGRYLELKYRDADRLG